MSGAQQKIATQFEWIDNFQIWIDNFALKCDKSG